MSIQDIVDALKELIVPSIVRTAKDERSLTAAGDYAAEDVLSNSATAGVATAWEFSGLVRKPGGKCLLIGAKAMLQTTNLTPRLSLYLFSAKPTSELRDNVANTAVLYADRRFYLGQIDLPALEDLGGMSVAIASPSTTGNLPIAFTCEPGDSKIYAIVVTRDAITAEVAGDTLAIELQGEPY